MYVIVCTDLAECREKVEDVLNELERKAELVAGMLESADEKTATFEELKKVLGGEISDAFYKTKVDSIEAFVVPSPALLRSELSKTGQELAKLIEIYRQLDEILTKIIEVVGSVEADVLILVSPEGAKLFINTR